MREKEPYEATKGGPITRKKAKRLKLKVKSRTIPQVRRGVGVHKGTVVRPE